MRQREERRRPHSPSRARSVGAGILSLVAIWAAPLTGGAQAQTVTLPAGAATGLSQNDQLYQVSCPGAGDCVGVGDYIDSGGATQALIEEQSGGVWSPSPVSDTSLPDASSTPHPYLTGVDCTSVGNCVAVDAYDDALSHEQGLIDTLSGGTWTPIAAPLTGLSVFSNPGVEVYAISCPSAGGCVGVGTYVSSNTYAQGLIETQSGAGWTPSEAPAPPHSNTQSTPTFSAVSCATVGNCAAVGNYTDTSGDQQGWLETESNGSWSAGELDLGSLGTGGNAPATDPQVTLDSVSCASPGDCTAVGSYLDSAGSYEGLLVNEVSGVWLAGIEATLPANASTAQVNGNAPQYDLYLNGVSCASAGNCTAVGSYDATSANNVEGLSVTETSDSWAAGVQVNPPSVDVVNPETSLDSVYCQTPADCVAAGTYVYGTGDNGALVARQTPSGWSAAGTDLASPYEGFGPSDYGASVDCSSDGYCAVAGRVAYNTAGSEQSFLLAAPSAPGTPSASLTSGQSGTSVTVSWSPPSDGAGLPLSSYTVTANDLTDAARGGGGVSVSATTTSAVLSGLIPGDTYNFTVTPSSVLGTGLPATSGSVSVSETSGPSITTGNSVTRSQITASLSGLVRKSTRATLASGSATTYTYRYSALEAGSVKVVWHVETGSGRSRHQTLIASGSTKLHRRGKVTIKVRLTKAGRRLLHAGGKLKVTALATFTGGGVVVNRTGRFTLA